MTTYNEWFILTVMNTFLNLDVPLNVSVCWSPEAQATFVPMSRVYDPETGNGAGTFLGWLGTDEHSPKAAVVRWDDPELGLREWQFDTLRNLYL